MPFYTAIVVELPRLNLPPSGAGTTTPLFDRVVIIPEDLHHVPFCHSAIHPHRSVPVFRRGDYCCYSRNILPLLPTGLKNFLCSSPVQRHYQFTHHHYLLRSRERTFPNHCAYCSHHFSSFHTTTTMLHFSPPLYLPPHKHTADD